MTSYCCDHLDDAVVERELAELVTQDCETTARLLSRLAVFDQRQLCRPAAYPSTFKYCVGKLGMSDDSAYKRIRAARAARKYPAIFAALADRRLTLTAVVLLSSHLEPRTADDLLAAAMHKTNDEIGVLLAERFQKPDLPAMVTELASPASAQLAARPVQPDMPRGKETPLSPRRFSLEMTVGQETHEKLRRAQELLGHAVAPGDLAAVLDRALDALIVQLEKRKLAATGHPRRSKVARGRRIPADVRRAVRERDGDRCTFTSESGKRCEERADLEFDHVVPVARGGESTAENVRLCCAAHNQHNADRDFGKGFMDAKRARSNAGAKPKAPNGEAARGPAPIASPSVPAPPLGARADEDPCTDVTPWLRRQGFTEDQVRKAAAKCEALPDAPIHERVRYALAFLVQTRGVPSKPAAKLTG